MRVRILSHMGREGFGERFLAERDGPDGPRPCEVRWAPESRDSRGAEAMARVRDAGLLLQLHPDPLVPEVWAVVPAWNGLAVVAESSGGTPLHQIDARPFPQPVILEILRQVADLLHRLHTRVDPDTGEALWILHRNVSTECIALRPDGTIRVTGFDRMSTTWTAREAETGVVDMNPGARLAPEQLAGQAFHASDVYLLGLVGVDLLSSARRVSGFAHRLAMCICDSEGFVQIRDECLQDPALEASEGLRTLLADMLEEDPQKRPSGRDVARRAARLGADPGMLRDFCGRLPPFASPVGATHPFVGRALEVDDRSHTDSPPPPVTADLSASSLLDAPDAPPVLPSRPQAPVPKPPRPMDLPVQGAAHTPVPRVSDTPHRPRLGNLPPTPPFVNTATPRDRSTVRITTVTPASRRVAPSEAPPPLPEGTTTLTPARPEAPVPPPIDPPDDTVDEAALARMQGPGSTVGLVVVIAVGLLLLLAAIGAAAWWGRTYFLP
ncbi:MAG: hypothetical protein JXB39_11010 [Deltaproteobacteria bacterium]|nr:hypothetical protein [Deltaproteobacteria bacterium]